MVKDKKLRIAVIAGGWSKEREVSLKSGRAVYDALDRRRYEVEFYDPKEDLKRLIDERDRIDLAFILLHGRYGEDGAIQGFLKILGIPFVGSGVLSSSISLNKAISKILYRDAGLDVADWILLKKGDFIDPDNIINTLGTELVIKPVSEGSSIGISISKDRESLIKGLKQAFLYDEEVIVERYIKGREVTCCVLGNESLEALPPIEIVPDKRYKFFDYEAKYTPEATKEICPAPLSEELTQRVKEIAIKAHRVLRCKVWSRTDMIIGDEKIYVLETNTIPGMTETSLVPLAARTAGLSMSELLNRILELAIEIKD